mgnify:CR=1 FL=1
MAAQIGDYTVESLDDGHTPGGSGEQNYIAINHAKATSNFVSVFDDVLSETWLQRVYDHAIEKGRPWGCYIPGKDALDSTLDAEEVFAVDRESGIALEAVRALLYGRGKDLIGRDALGRVHGTAVHMSS